MSSITFDLTPVNVPPLKLDFWPHQSSHLQLNINMNIFSCLNSNLFFFNLLIIYNYDYLRCKVRLINKIEVSSEDCRHLQPRQSKRD
jgi:hypothetical protein